MKIQTYVNHRRPFPHFISAISNLLLILCFPALQYNHATAQSSPPPTTDEGFSGYSSSIKLSPRLSIVLAILVASFFFMGFFFVYVRHCAQRRPRGRYDPSSDLLATVRNSMRAARGLEADVIKSFPTFLYSKVKGLRIGQTSLECAVCLCEFEDHETLRLIPNCSHVFHPHCIDAWLTFNTTCPVCRANLVPKPGEMISFYPVQEVEPPVGSETRADENSKDQVVICVEPELQSPRVDSINPNASFRSKSSNSMSRLNKKSFLRSNSTGHLLFQSDEKYERFTLRLPDDVRNQLVNPTLNHGSNDVAFTRVNSTRKGYRSGSGSVSKWHGSSHFNYERFDRESQGESEPWRFTLTRPFFSRTSSIRSQENGDNDEVKHTPPTNLSIPSTSSVDGERSSGHLRAQSQI